MQDNIYKDSTMPPSPLKDLQVIGAGFGRTGTLSLKLALERLGFGRVYHMESVFAHPWHVRHWRRAFAQRAASDRPLAGARHYAWERPLAGCRAAIDWPACTFYDEIARRSPQAKVILTVRDPQAWYDSAARTIYAVMHGFPFDRLGRSLPLIGGLGPMLDELIWQGTFGGHFTDRRHAIDVFERHNATVIASLPPERLLVFDVRQGWEPLCAFLNRPVPAASFPHANDAAAYQKRVQRLTLGMNRLRR